MIPKHIQDQYHAFKAKQQAQKQQEQQSAKIGYEDNTMTEDQEDKMWDDLQVKWEEDQHQYYLKMHEKAYDEFLDQMVQFL